VSIELDLPDGRKGVLLNAKTYGTDLRLAVQVSDNETSQTIIIPVIAEIQYVDSARVEPPTKQ
jgi:hypothetical protein